MNRFVLTLCLFAPTLAIASETAGGIQWAAPSDWKAHGARGMRAATYEIGPAKGDSEPAELAVFFFGAGQGGSVDANVKRWISQFEQADGSPSEKAAKTSSEMRGHLKITTLELSGTYLASVGGPMMGGATTKKPNYRLLGAIVEGPEGPVFFKLTGPRNTVKAAEAGFKKLLKSIAKSS